MREDYLIKRRVHRTQIVDPQGSQRCQDLEGVEEICNKEKGSRHVACHITVLGIHVLSHYCTEKQPATHCLPAHSNTLFFCIMCDSEADQA